MATGKEFEALLSTYQYTITIGLSSSIVVAVIAALLIFCILYQILYGLFFWVIEMRPARGDDDLEEGNIHPAAYTVRGSSFQVAIFQAMVQSNLQAWRMLEPFKGDMDEKRGQRLRDSKKLPPLVNYGSHDAVRSCGECVICLQDFKVGEFCQVFPACSHIFHSNCIDSWLVNKLTCPICRCRISD